MTTLTPLPRLASGALALPGVDSPALYDIDFSTLTTVPASVTTEGTSGGTGAIAGTAPAAVLRLTCGAVVGSQARALLPAIDVSQYESVVFQISATAPASGYPQQIFFGMEGSTNLGMSWRRDTQMFVSRNSDTPIFGGQMIGRAGRTSKTTFGFALFPARKIIAVLSGNDVVNAGYFPGFLSGALTPKVIVHATAAAANTLDIRRIRLLAKSA